jgi:hypothetical protein
MNKVLSFSLFGNIPMYCVGAIKNADLAKLLYPGWKCLFWHDDSVPEHYLKLLEERDNVSLINVGKTNVPGRYWRFFVFRDKSIDIFCIRDTDSRLSQREVDAVSHFIQSGKALHVMRDHPHHNFLVMAGMWSFRNDIAHWDIEKNLDRWLQNIKVENKIDDTNFLRELYYDFFDNMVVHDNWRRCEISTRFPSKREGQRFVGEIFNEDDIPEDHYKMISPNE